jgi:hypothetical protein
MAQIKYRANLSAKAFPFLTDFQGRTVIVPGPDNTFNRSLTSQEDADKDVGVPIIYYCHNVFPAPYGFNSVGYEQLIPPLLPTVDTFTEAKLLRSNAISSTVNGPRFYFAPQPSGTHYTFILGGTRWLPISTSVPYTSDTTITYATLQGISYIFFSGIGCYKWDSATNTLIAVTLTGLVAANILGIATYQGYMISYDESSVYWSSTLDIDYTSNAVDFTPSLATGAGNIRPEGAKGSITIVLPATFGLAIYTSSNIVSAVYSGNSRYPFNFKEVVASGGCSSAKLVTYDANTGNQYAYTTSGMQTVTQTVTQTVFPEVTDFLAGSDFEDYNDMTGEFERTTLTDPMVKKLSSIADRYLIISYGVSSLTHAIVYDMTQKRYGKLKISHVDCFEFEYLDPAIEDAPRKSIAFLKEDGSVYILNPSITFASSSGVILLGKFQYVRSRLLSLEEVELQTVHPSQAAVVYDLVSTSGGTLESTTKYQCYETSQSGEAQRTYKIHKTGVNHSILVVGGFFLSSLQLTFHVHGNR